MNPAEFAKLPAQEQVETLKTARVGLVAFLTRIDRDEIALHSRFSGGAQIRAIYTLKRYAEFYREEAARTGALIKEIDSRIADLQGQGSTDRPAEVTNSEGKAGNHA